MLRALGYNKPDRFHMNEGHASLLTLELLYEQARKANRTTIVAEDLDAVRQQCIFTTHTPVPAGHDKFPLDMVQRADGPSWTSSSTRSNVLVASCANHIMRRGDGNGGRRRPDSAARTCST